METPKTEKSNQKRLKANAADTTTRINTPKRAEARLLWVILMKMDRLVRQPQIRSSIARENMSVMQAPKRSPMARSGNLAKVTADKPLASSGKEVTIARRTIPIKAWLKPVL